MPVNLKLYLPPTARIERVGIALGALHGLPVDVNRGIASCPGVRVETNSNWPEMVTIYFTTPHGEARRIHYHFEVSSTHSHGGVQAGYRGIFSMTSTARNIAVAKRLIHLFGGRLVYMDTSEKTFDKPDLKVRANPINAAEDKEPFDGINTLLANIKPVTTEEIRECAKDAAYPYRPEAMEQKGFDKKMGIE